MANYKIDILTVTRKPQAKLKPKPQAKNKTLALSTHITALIVACFVVALAFGFPLEGVKLTLGEGELPPIHNQIEVVVIPLPDETEVTRFQVERLSPFDNWTTATVQPGDNLTEIFSRLGLKANDLYSLMACCAEAKTLETLLPGQMFKIRTNREGGLVELVLTADEVRGTRIFRDGDIFKAGKYQHTIEKRQAFISGVVKNGFADEARRVSLSKRLLRQLHNIFAKRLDLNKDLRKGDAYTIIYEEDYFSGEKIGDGEILAVDLITDSERYRIVGFRNGNGDLRYYNENGKGIRPAFLRYPLQYQRISSKFSLGRRHPILGKRRPHNGVDFRAATGTPIKATGDGVVERAGWQRGFGKTITLDHGRGYTTLYAHMSRLHPKIRQGVEVSRGQIIGYVGRTGLATGSHLHYEFHINDRPQDPLSVKLPGDPAISKQRLARFQDQVQPLLAQLDLHHRTRLALASAD